MNLNPNNCGSGPQQSSSGGAFSVKEDPEKGISLADATATANTLADISSIISQQFTNYNDSNVFMPDSCDNGSATRCDMMLEHPCWDYLQRVDEHNCIVCRICSETLKPVDTQKAMGHFISRHPQVAVELDHSWQMKLQLKMNVNRPADESPSYKESSEKRGHGTEHPCWRYFTRDRKSADCRMCGVHVAYACSGNLMRHLRSRHVAESVITQKEWEEIQKRKKQLCEMRLMASASACGSEEQSPSNAISYSCGDEEHDESMGGAGEEDDGTLENYEQKNRKEVSMSNNDIKMTDGADAVSRNTQTFGVPAHPPEATSLGRQQESWPVPNASHLRPLSVGKNVAFQKRINSFVSGLAEELTSFPIQKSLLCMRRIRKFMDEQLLELDENIQNSEDDASIT